MSEHPSRTTDHHDTRPPREDRHERLTAADPVPLRDDGIADGGGVTPVSRPSPSADQVIYGVVYTALRRILREGVQAGLGAAEGLNSLQCRFAGALYALLMAHPIDRRGRCRHCRRPGSVIGRRRQSCAVYLEVDHWLHHSDERLRTQAALQWGLTPSPSPAATTPQARRRVP
ncbi:MAG: hypothetical protein ACRDQ4_05700 [Pseudonocardiaceae bacterium]